MSATFLVVPEWQGSGSSRAMQLIDGADAIAGDLPSSVTTRLEIPLGAGESLGTGVARVSALRSIRDSVTRALRDSAVIADAAAAAAAAARDELGDEAAVADPAAPDIVVTIGGDCGVELAPVAEAVRAHPGVAVVWLDAHADLMRPAESGASAFSGMVLRTLLGDGPDLLVPEFDQTVSPGRLVLAGVRSIDDDEQAYIEASSIREVSVDALQQSEELTRGDALVEAIAATGATSVYLHVDLDVLDPAEIAGVSYPEPFGLSVAALVENIMAVRQRFTLVGAGITQFAPASPDAASDDLSAVLRVISALTRAL
ncbi:arginase family protein [Subtercola sp. YIM 133946]|uniref:arginase family protein n=1 Tax=Subtercola sp. YIM 133946 TaxID=3118909 RepID=UPI002F95799E